MRLHISIVVLWAAALPLAALGQKPSAKDNSGGASKPSDAVHDVVANTFSAIVVDPADLGDLDKDLAALEASKALTWREKDQEYKAGTTLFHLATRYVPSKNFPVPSCAKNAAVDQAYIFHVTHWINRGNDPTADSPATLLSSDWYVYRHARHLPWQEAKKAKDLIRVDLTGAGDPLIYGASRVLIVGIDRFDPLPNKDVSGNPVPTFGKLSPTYSVTVTQGTPENAKNFGALVGALGGISQAALAASSDATFGAYIAVACQEGTRKLPFDLAVTDAVEQTSSTPAQGISPDKKPSDSGGATTPGNATCSGKGNTPSCSMNRTFTSTDREYWDVSIGVATPGVRETSYTFSSSTSKVSQSVTTHTELYAFLDFYPFGALKPKESWIPHINAGIPVTTKSLYRPYFGIAENLTGWTHLQKSLSLPAAVSVFVGMTFMKTHAIVGPPPTTQEQFNSAQIQHRVWKPMFGIEVPVSSIASKLGGKGGGSGSKNANGSGKGGP